MFSSNLCTFPFLLQSVFPHPFLVSPFPVLASACTHPHFGYAPPSIILLLRNGACSPVLVSQLSKPSFVFQDHTRVSQASLRPSATVPALPHTFSSSLSLILLSTSTAFYFFASAYALSALHCETLIGSSISSPPASSLSASPIIALTIPSTAHSDPRNNLGSHCHCLCANYLKVYFPWATKLTPVCMTIGKVVTKYVSYEHFEEKQQYKSNSR